MQLFRLSGKPGSGEEERESVLATDTDPQAPAQDATDAEAEVEASADATASHAPADGETEGRQNGPSSEPADIPIQDLLNDLVGVSQSLGITPRAPPEPSSDEPSGDEPTADEPSGDQPSADEPSGDQPSADEPSGGELPDVDAERSEEEDTAEPDAPEGPLAALSPTAYRRYALHVLLLSLALIAAIVGLIGAGQLARTALPDSSPDDVQARHSKPPIVVATVPASGENQAQAAAEPAPGATPEPAPQLQPAYFLYTVQAGDTITAIAETFAISPEYVLWNNPDVIEDPNTLLVDEKLLIPSVDGIIFRVKPGDTLPGIAAQYQIDIESILAFAPNGLTSADNAIEGMVLILPGAVPPLLPRLPEVVEPTAFAPQPTQPAPTPEAPKLSEPQPTEPTPEAPTPSEPQPTEPTPTDDDSPSFSIGHIYP